MQNRVKITLRTRCIIGILPKERVKKQKVMLKFSAKCVEFVDYVEIYTHLKSTLKREKFKLLEDALNFIANEIHALYPQIKSLKLSIFKPKIIKNAKLGVSVRCKFSE